MYVTQECTLFVFFISTIYEAELVDGPLRTSMNTDRGKCKENYYTRIQVAYSQYSNTNGELLRKTDCYSIFFKLTLVGKSLPCEAAEIRVSSSNPQTFSDCSMPIFKVPQL